MELLSGLINDVSVLNAAILHLQLHYICTEKYLAVPCMNLVWLLYYVPLCHCAIIFLHSPIVDSLVWYIISYCGIDLSCCTLSFESVVCLWNAVSYCSIIIISCMQRDA